MKISIIVLLFFIGILVIILSKYTYSNRESFLSPKQCSFKKLGSYKLSTNQSLVNSSSSKGLIYIQTLKSWDMIAYRNPSDLLYSYTNFTPNDATGINVKQRINNLMKCNKIPEYSNSAAINSRAALILCLQSDTTPGSRVFFVKCFVPQSNSSDSNVIIGEIAENKADIYTDKIKPVAHIQGGVGTPNLTDTYTLSYTICSANSRPEGFSYTDCCSNILSTVAVPSSDMNTDDLKECNEISLNNISTDTSNTNSDTSRSGKHDPTCKKGKYSLVTGGECIGTYDTETYLLLTKPGDKNCKAGKKSLMTGTDCVGTYDTELYLKLIKRNGLGNWGSYADFYKSKDIYDFDPSCGKNGTVNTRTGLICASPLGNTLLSNTSSSNNKRPNEYSWPQKYKSSDSDTAKKSDSALKPGLSECQKYYNCQKKEESNDCGDCVDYDYEGEC